MSDKKTTESCFFEAKSTKQGAEGAAEPRHTATMRLDRAYKAREERAKFNNHRDVAQLVARLLWEQDVAGSNPVIPTILVE